MPEWAAGEFREVPAMGHVFADDLRCSHCKKVTWMDHQWQQEPCENAEPVPTKAPRVEYCLHCQKELEKRAKKNRRHYCDSACKAAAVKIKKEAAR